MLASMKKLAALPPETTVYCGHEYTLSNARFAVTVDPGNELLKVRAQRVERMRGGGKVTLPTTIGDELATNPFLRWNEPGIRATPRHGGCFGGRSVLPKSVGARTISDCRAVSLGLQQEAERDHHLAKVDRHPDRRTGKDAIWRFLLDEEPLGRQDRIRNDEERGADDHQRQGQGSRGCEHGDDCHGIGDDRQAAVRRRWPAAASRTAPPSRQSRPEPSARATAPQKGCRHRRPRSSPPPERAPCRRCGQAGRQPARRGSTVRHPGPATHRQTAQMISAATRRTGPPAMKCQEGQQGCRCRLQKRAPPGGVGAPQHEIEAGRADRDDQGPVGERNRCPRETALWPRARP